MAGENDIWYENNMLYYIKESQEVPFFSSFQIVLKMVWKHLWLGEYDTWWFHSVWEPWRWKGGFVTYLHVFSP